MIDKKISELDTLVNLADDDLFTIVDVSDASMSPTGTNKKVHFNSLVQSISDQLPPPTVDYSFLMPVGTIYTNKTNSANPATYFGFGTWVAIEGEVIVGYKAGDADFGTAGVSKGAKTHTLTEAELASHYHEVNPPSTASGGRSAQHNHSQNAHGHTVGYSGGLPLGLAAGASGVKLTYSGAGNSAIVVYDNTATNNPETAEHTHTTDIAAFNSGNKGSGTAHNNIQPSRVCYVWERTA